MHVAALAVGPAAVRTPLFGLSAIDALAWFCILSAAAVTIGKVVRGGPVLRAIPGLVASLLPLLAWYAFIGAAAPTLAASAAVPLIFGLTICTHIVELLRRCLIGTRARPFDPVLIAVGWALLVGTLLVGSRADSLALLALLAIVARFAWQLVETVFYIMRRRGDRLLTVRR
jgi:hypothetical protein